MNTDAVSILADLVRIRSINPPGEEAGVCDYLKKFFQELGIPVSLKDGLPGRQNLIARLIGANPGAWVFTGHMDVVPVSPAEAVRWQSDPFEPQIREGRMYGRGTSDMKAGLAAAMAAMARLKQQQVVPPHDIVLCATVDEEYLMRGSAALMREGFVPDAKGIIVCEPTGLALCPASRGRTFGRIEFFGATGHGSNKDGSLNAIELAVAFINAMKQVRFPHQDMEGSEETFWRPLSIEAGVEPGVVPDQCSLGIDARLAGTEPVMIWEKARELLAALSRKYPAMHYEIRIDDEREPWSAPADDPLSERFALVLEQAGIPVRQRVFPGTTDGTKFRRGGAPCVIIGPGDLSLVHRENESVDVEEVERAAALYLDFMKRS